MSRFESSVPSHKQNTRLARVFCLWPGGSGFEPSSKKSPGAIFREHSEPAGTGTGKCRAILGPHGKGSESSRAQPGFRYKDNSHLDSDPGTTGLQETGKDPAQQRKSLTGITQRQKTKIFSPSKSGDFYNSLFIKCVVNLLQVSCPCFLCKKGLHPCRGGANILYSLINQASF